MNTQRGITMIELLVVFALVAIVGGFTLLVSMDTLRASVSRSDRDLIVSTLQRARSQAMNNVCVGSGCTDGKAHGVKIDVVNKKIILFQGATYVAGDPANAEFELNTNTITGADEIVFQQLSGNTAAQTKTTVTDDRGQASEITVEPWGQIVWTH